MPKVSSNPAMVERWAEDRQYLRNDAREALAAFRRKRAESLALVRRLTPAELERGCVHSTGRITIDRFVAMMAWHDDNHLDQVKRALAGKA